MTIIYLRNAVHVPYYSPTPESLCPQMKGTVSRRPSSPTTAASRRRRATPRRARTSGPTSPAAVGPPGKSIYAIPLYDYINTIMPCRLVTVTPGSVGHLTSSDDMQRCTVQYKVPLTVITRRPLSSRSRR